MNTTARFLLLTVYTLIFAISFPAPINSENNSSFYEIDYQTRIDFLNNLKNEKYTEAKIQIENTSNQKQKNTLTKLLEEHKNSSAAVKAESIEALLSMTSLTNELNSLATALKDVDKLSDKLKSIQGDQNQINLNLTKELEAKKQAQLHFASCRTKTTEELNKECRAKIIVGLANEAWQLRKAAIETLRYYKTLDPEFVEHLEKAGTDSHLAIRQAAVKLALEKQQHDIISKLLTHPNAKVRASAVYGLQKNDPDSISKLKNLLSDTDTSVSINAAEVLSLSDISNSKEMLSEFIEHNDIKFKANLSSADNEQVKQSIRFLGLKADDSSIDLLLEQINHKNMINQTQAQIALTKIGEPVVPKLIPLLENTKEYELASFSRLLHVATSLAKYAQPLIPVLSRAIEQEQNEIKRSMLTKALAKIQQTK